MYNPYNKDYENKILENLKNRAKLLIEADKDPKFRACLIAKCKEDPKFFFNNFLYTVKNSTFFSPDMPEDIPFMLFDYQEDVVDEIHGCIIGRENVFVEKSRQMSLTWLVLGLFIHGFVFNNHRYCVISRTEDEVDGKGAIDSCFGRLRYMIARLPQWMLPPKFPKTKGEDYNKSMALTRSDGVGSIIGKTANKDAGRGGTYTAILMDEMAFMENATQINGACSSATPCRIMNSTPNGEGNEYFRMRALARQGKIKGITLHWTLHPFYTKDWYEWRTAGMTPEDIERELEINYNVSVKGRVYPRFAQAPLGDVRFLDVKYDYTLPLYVSIDNSHGGEDPHAVIVFQTESNGDIKIIDSLQKNCSFTEMAHFLAKRPLQGVMTDKEQAFFLRWMGYKNPIFIADPYDTESTMNDTSIAAEYAKVGINLVTPDILKGGSMIKEQIRLTTQAMNRLLVNPMNTEFISAIQNASYPQRPENSQSTSENTKPIHNWCVTGDTKVRTTKGWKQIKDIVAGEYVWGYSTKEKRLVPTIVSWSGKTRENAEIIEIGLDNGKSIKCTPDHLFMRRNGEYVRADELKPQDSLMPFYEYNDRGYISIDLNDETQTSEHRFVYNRFKGFIEAGHHIDHIDGDHFNNNPDNLQKLSQRDHCGKTFGNIRKGMYEHLDKTDYTREFYSKSITIKNCLYCGAEFKGDHKHSYCTRACQKIGWKENNNYKNRTDRDPLLKEKRKIHGKQHEENKKHPCEICGEPCSRKAKRCKKCVYKKNHKVRFIKTLSHREDVYDLTVPETSNFVAEGVVIHNCSHFRTALEYAILFLTQEEKKNTVQEPVYTQVPNYATGELEWKLQTF